MKKYLPHVLFLIIFVMGFILVRPAIAVPLQTLENQSKAWLVWSEEKGVNQETHGALETMNGMATMTHMLICVPGIGKVVDPECTNNESAVGMVKNGVVAMYKEKPADAQMYLADLGSRAGIVRPAYAQGIGFRGLSPILSLWKVFRNIAYGFLTVIMAAIGFMILFRMKIDPRTVISVQSALPRLVVTLILITFSYAIAAVMIDIMYLFIYLFLIALRSATTQTENAAFIQAFQSLSGAPLSDVWNSLFNLTGDFRDSINGLISTVTGGANVQAISGVVGGLLGGVLGLGLLAGLGLGTVAAIGAGATIGGVLGSGNILALLIVALALFFAYLRILFLLVTTYIQILLAIIFGPMYLLFGAIPNVDAFGSWIRGLIANLAVFPIVSTMIALAALLTAFSRSNENFWIAPGLGSDQGGHAALGLIGFGMIVLIPTVVNSFKELLKAKSPLPVGAAIGGAVTAPGQTAMQMLSTFYYLKNITGPRIPKER